MKDDIYKSLLDYYQKIEPQVLEEQIALTEIPSPVGHETEKAIHLAQRLKELGACDVVRDEVDNVYGVLPGKQKGPTLVLGAHMDTAFTVDTDFTVVRDGDRITGPGVGDDTAGIVMLFAVMQSFQELGIVPGRDIVILFTVGEEGRGDLRGAHHFFNTSPYKDQVTGFITLDQGSTNIVNSGIGSRRWEITVRGPGGHSWGCFGRVNPIHILSSAIAEWSQLDLSEGPRSNCSVGVISGGSTVNAIPTEATLELDLRSIDQPTLVNNEKKVFEILHAALEQHNNARIPADSDPAVLEAICIGDRPTGITAEDSALVKAAVGALNAEGYDDIRFTPSSTDANVPMSKGIDGIALYRGGTGGLVHTPQEWFEAGDRYKATLALVRVIDEQCEGLTSTR
jgi:tripeptide aminopeptidase